MVAVLASAAGLTAREKASKHGFFGKRVSRVVMSGVLFW